MSTCAQGGKAMSPDIRLNVSALGTLKQMQDIPVVFMALNIDQHIHKVKFVKMV
jgi:hypothetical protein